MCAGLPGRLQASIVASIFVALLIILFSGQVDGVALVSFALLILFLSGSSGWRGIIIFCFAYYLIFRVRWMAWHYYLFLYLSSYFSGSGGCECENLHLCFMGSALLLQFSSDAHGLPARPNYAFCMFHQLKRAHQLRFHEAQAV